MIFPHEILHEFGITGDQITAERFGNGLINDTFSVTTSAPQSPTRFIAQRINHHIFKNPEALMRNVRRVCEHIRTRLTADAADDIARKCLTLLPTSSGQSYHIHKPVSCDDEPSYWRFFAFIDHCTSYSVVETIDQAYEAARCFGEFQRLVTDLPGDRLTETIPDFHNTPRRLEALHDAIARDPVNRAASCREEINFAISNASIASHLLSLHHQGLIPERITHNDTKLANVLIDDITGKGVCVVDLDTVMPGLSLYDFGDLVRTCVSPIEEDSPNLDAIQVRLPMFESLAQGFLDEMADVLTPAERSNLPFAGKLLTYEVGIRFLTDYLNGDTYFSTSRPHHNLDRARNQFRLVSRMEAAQKEMQLIVDSLSCSSQPVT
jgi:Ser/Thr protein kinase RdoA (MazF antagonist)